jgi:hypothetical protein
MVSGCGEAEEAKPCTDLRMFFFDFWAFLFCGSFADPGMPRA